MEHLFQFDWTVTLGNLTTVVGFFAAGIAFVSMMRSDLRLLTFRMSAVEEAIKTLADTEVAIARQDAWRSAFDERMDTLTTRLDQHINFTLENYRNKNKEGR